MPDTASDAIVKVVQHLPQGWLDTLGDWESALPEAMAEPVVVGLMLSGPTSLLSCIGAVLANRCAATLPARRFRVMTAMVSCGFACVALAMWVTPRPFAGLHRLRARLRFRCIREPVQQRRRINSGTHKDG